MPRRALPYVLTERTRHGRVAYYFRVGTGPRIRLPDTPGSPEFLAAYQAALAGDEKPKAGRARSGSLRWLFDRYRDSAAWVGLSPATRRQRENIMSRIIAAEGEQPFDWLTREAVRAGLDRRRATPAAARHFLDTLRGAYRWGVEAGLAKTDPTEGLHGPKKTTEGHHTWTEGEVAAYEARWPVGTRERLAFDVLLYTGLRRGDAVRVGRQHVRDSVITIRTEKNDETVTIPILPELAASIEAGPCGDLAFIAGLRGLPLTKESFGTIFRGWCSAAGVPGSAHGLRKCGATRAANAGLTEYELMALYGWREARTAAIYTRQANRESLSKRASAKLLKGRTENR